MSHISYTFYTMDMIKIVIFTTKTGTQPFVAWLDALNVKTQAIVVARIARVRGGNFGDCKLIKGGAGIRELRIDYRPGFRIYFGKKETTIVVLLTGGNKSSQNRDIEKAKRYWLAYKELSHE